MLKAFNLTISLIAGAAFAVVAMGAMSAPAYAGEMESSIARGGKLYDKWYAVIKADKPSETHKAWPASNTKKKGDTTWRCKSCHGWDGLGKDGAYASGSYKTGIPGISGMINAPIDKIVAVLKDGTHGLAGKMADQDFADLALFVSKGQVDMDMYIDRATKKPKGNVEQGAAYYNTICAGCHGMDGKLPKDMPPLGSLMGNPWEIMHKIMNGQPAEKMPALRAVPRDIVTDLMAYMTTLPKE